MKIFKYEKEIEILFIILTFFLIFYWTYLIFENSIIKYKNLQVEKLEKYYKINELVLEAGKKKSKKVSNLKLRGSLLSNFQKIAKKVHVENKILSIKPDTMSKKENIKVRLESVNYKELLGLLKSLERYSNISVKNLLIRKRFDNPEYVDISLMIVKT
jgi:hypothetical protein